MKVRSTPWDDHNLGVSTIEVRIEALDAIMEINRVISSLVENFQIIRVPTSRLDVNLLLSRLGFYFSESLFRLDANVNSLGQSALGQVAKRDVTIEAADKNHLENLRKEILGLLFRSDRISLDPSELRSRSGIRYWNWICDEIARGATVRILRSPKRELGFFTFRKLNDQSAEVALSGTFGDKTSPTAGLLLQNAILETCYRENVRLLKSSISSNNISAIRVCLAAGYEIVDCEYVFTRNSLAEISSASGRI